MSSTEVSSTDLSNTEVIVTFDQYKQIKARNGGAITFPGECNLGSMQRGPELHVDGKSSALIALHGDPLGRWTRMSPIAPHVGLDGVDSAIIAGIIRGEIPSTCNCNGSSTTTWTHGSGLKLTVSGEHQPRHRVCSLTWLWKLTAELRQAEKPCIMPRFGSHRLHSIVPMKNSPVSEAQQVKGIGAIRKALDNAIAGKQRSLILVGPAGTSKTTWLAAFMRDLHTLKYTDYRYRKMFFFMRQRYWVNTRPEKILRNWTLPIWSISAVEWLQEMHAWETRSLDRDAAREPSVTVKAIRQLSVLDASKVSRGKPVLWIEEIDKFKFTEARESHLFTLINEVYAQDGLLVASANMTKKQLKDHVGEPLFRRLTGANEVEGEYTFMDLHNASGR